MKLDFIKRRHLKITIPDQLHDELVALKFKTGIDMSEHIRIAITEYLDKRR